MAAPLTYRQRAARKWPRLKKLVRQWTSVAVKGRPRSTRAVFVVGSQRSGTRLPLQVLDHVPEVMTFSEGSAPYFRGVLLEPLPRVEALLRRSPFPVVALKPICETHRVLELLDRFPDARAIWIFRHYPDAVNSASVKWTSGTEAVRRLAAGDLQGAGWRAGGLTPEKLDVVRRLYDDRMSLHAANALMWYLRNDLYFDLKACDRPDVLLVRYEDLVSEPKDAFVRVFGFLGLQPPPGFESSVYGSSVSRRGFPEIPTEIKALCDGLEERLLAHYRAGLVTPFPTP